MKIYSVLLSMLFLTFSLNLKGFELSSPAFSIGLKEGTEQTLFSVAAMKGRSAVEKAAIGTTNILCFGGGAAGTAVAVYAGLSGASGTEEEITNAKRGGEALLKFYGAYQINRFQKKLKDRVNEREGRNGSEQVEAANQNHEEMSLKEAIKFTAPSAFREGARTGFVIGTSLHTVDETVGKGTSAAAIASVVGSAVMGSAAPVVIALLGYGGYKLAECHNGTRKLFNRCTKPAYYILDKGLNLLKWSLLGGAVHEVAELAEADPRLYCLKEKDNPLFAPVKALTPFSPCPDPFQAAVGIAGVYDTFGKPLVSEVRSRCRPSADYPVTVADRDNRGGLGLSRADSSSPDVRPANGGLP